ncbi:hypothetical protein K1719_034633 [Acacia pycnantha]|nr:hypothetical protein K1719_034633 [Acacia pycnantha]
MSFLQNLWKPKAFWEYLHNISGMSSKLFCCYNFYDQKLTSSSSQARTELVNIYTGNERPIILFLFFESALSAALAGVVRFGCTFWLKRKIQNKGLGNFLEKRRSLQLQKKAFDRKITELKGKVLKKEETGDEVYKKMDDMVNSTHLAIQLPEKVAPKKIAACLKKAWTRLIGQMAKGKTPMDDDDDTSSDEEESVGREYISVFSEAKASLKLFISSSEEQDRLGVRSFEGEKEVVQRSGSSTWLKRRKTSSSIN